MAPNAGNRTVVTTSIAGIVPLFLFRLPRTSAQEPECTHGKAYQHYYSTTADPRMGGNQTDESYRGISNPVSVEGRQTRVLFGRIYDGSYRPSNNLRLVQVNQMSTGPNHEVPAVG